MAVLLTSIMKMGWLSLAMHFWFVVVEEQTFKKVCWRISQLILHPFTFLKMFLKMFLNNILHPFTFLKNIFAGSAKKLYRSVHSKIFSLPDHFKLFPAHDYKGFTSTTVLEEKQFNPRLTKSEDEFIEIMNNLGLDYPKMIGLYQICSLSISNL